MNCKHFICHQCDIGDSEYNGVKIKRMYEAFNEWLKVKERFGWSFETAEDLFNLLDIREKSL